VLAVAVTTGLLLQAGHAVAPSGICAPHMLQNAIGSPQAKTVLQATILHQQNRTQFTGFLAD
jgi:hypothetical protein